MANSRHPNEQPRNLGGARIPRTTLDAAQVATRAAAGQRDGCPSQHERVLSRGFPGGAQGSASQLEENV
ncbi:hypothetical protein PI124_g18104 [Phytophthora idaei]|nr:hypothetical protein PI125_g21137 [Phytophthora idaei]KAG3137484.1 hypothetical protein PI126_g17386 [Phytophthora idaei]KAG3236895.1 hypothetical protein PI124_g18104 [Phytophthora idaei]